MRHSRSKAIPLVEFCMACNLGEEGDYELYHPATDEQLDNLREHVVSRAQQLYIQSLNTNWNEGLAYEY